MKQRIVIIYSLVLLGCWSCKEGQTYNTSIHEEFEKHIEYLASDELEGRMSGTPGEMKAISYIESQFKSVGLVAGDSDADFLQDFEFISGRKLGDQNLFELGSKSQALQDDYYPLAMSATGSAKAKTILVGFGISAPDLTYDDYRTRINRKGQVFVIEISSPDGLHPHSKYVEHNSLDRKIETAIKNGAAAVIFVNSDEKADNPTLDLKNKIQPTTIPVIFSTQAVKPNVLANITVEINTQKATGNNVLGYLDNGAQQTIVIGAHHDHLGHGEGGNSLYRGEPQIHNGADDNASGVAMVIELAKVVKSKQYKRNNFLFITFSGEELGLYGSNHFVKNPSTELANVNAMINFDMVGKLENNQLKVLGVGTSPNWNTLMDHVKPNTLDISTSESGVGPSDQTSFYLKDIPVLHFFTGAHEHYHKPTDDVEIINYSGLRTIKRYVIDLLDELEEEPKLTFSKTTDEDNDQAPKFKVTLGVIPDYLYEERGMRIDGVTDGKTAAVAGIKSGDIVISMGKYEVKDMMSYMQALSYFEKGDTSSVTVLRNAAEVAHQVIFQ